MIPVNLLLVEDNPADIDLTIEAFNDAQIFNTMHICRDGVEALDFLHQRNKYTAAPRPDLILLDLNMPRMGGLELLDNISREEHLRKIPIVVLTTSDDKQDIVNSYEHNANCYITKPVDFSQFIDVVKSIEDFWLSIVKLPH